MTATAWAILTGAALPLLAKLATISTIVTSTYWYTLLVYGPAGAACLALMSEISLSGSLDRRATPLRPSDGKLDDCGRLEYGLVAAGVPCLVFALIVWWLLSDQRSKGKQQKERQNVTHSILA